MAPVVLRTPRRMFVGSYRKVGIEIDPGSGLSFEDLDFTIDVGPVGGVVSLSRETGFDPERPDVMLLAGPEPGTYLLQAFDRNTSSLVGESKFSVTTSWTRKRLGPSRWFMGRNEIRAAGSAWGGGPAGPQNLNVVPATGTRRIAILLVDTTSERYTSDAPTLQGIRDRWLDETFRGVVSGGVARSVAHFYREVSYGAFDVTAQAFGPVSLSTSFDDNFNADGTPKGAYLQRCFTAGDGVIDYRNFDTLLCVSQSVPASGTTPAKSAWPWATIGAWGPYSTSDGDVTRGFISMPNEWGTTSAREVYETLSHELGHNLGLGDQYTPSVPGRNVMSWDMMDSDNPFPHFSLVHRMMLGWIQAGWMQTFDFSASGAIDQTASLSPIEVGAPPSGRKAGMVRLADGWNYYFEYRHAQGGQIGDRSLPTGDRVLGIDALTSPAAPVFSRPFILLLNNDIDGDGAVLGNGQDYEERDTTDPTYPTDFIVDVSGVDGSKADVRVRYGLNNRPDPSIRPWPAGPGREWQSPDIEVQNARNATDPAWFNVPWVGEANTIVASVKNNSTANAPGVRVNFYVKNFNVGGAPEAFLATDVRDIGPGATVQFTANWVPPSTGHFCVVVRIPLYQVPTALSVVELTELNNVAQSNYDRFISASSSAATREVSYVEVGNPYDITTRVFLVGNQTNPVYRTYLQHTWLVLDPGETKKVRVMFEYAPTGDKHADDAAGLVPAEVKEFARVPNDVGIHSIIEDPRDNPRHKLEVLGGGQTQVVTRRGTRFQDVTVDPKSVSGALVTIDDREPVPGGTVLVSLSSGRVDDGEQPRYVEAKLTRGRFEATLEGKWTTLTAHYVPAPGFGDCRSRTIKNPG